jgi:radical SAM superfamily enzyme YgiQ (UPF0313 family)
MSPGARFKADVVLIAPREMEVTRAQPTYREKNFTTFTELLGVRSFQQDYIRRINESLGLECLAHYLREAGLRVVILNCNVAQHTAREMVEKIKFSEARVVGISLIYRPQVKQAMELLEGLKGLPDITVCMGGALASFMPSELLGRLVRLDSIVFGEAEETFRDYACAVLGGGDPSGLPGIAFRDGDRMVMNPAAAPLDLARILPPSRDTLTHLESLGLPTNIASIYTSRGCFAPCTFCTGKDAYNVERKPTYRYREPTAVVDEMQYLKERFGVKFVYINDDNFLGYGKPSFARVRAIAEELIGRDLRIPFATECRVDALDPELMLLLKAAGMTQVLLGIESGSDKVLKRWRKGATAEDNRRAIELVKRVGVNLEPGFILLDAHTTAEELGETVDFIEATGLHRTTFPTYLVNRLSVYPGTAIERLLVLDGTIRPSEIRRGQPTVDAPDDILREFARLEYVCRDARTEIVWRCLRRALEPVEQCIEDLLPRATEALLRARRNSAAAATKARASALMRSAGAWRRRLGTLVVRSLRICIESYEIAGRAAQYRWLRARLSEARAEYERSTFGMPIQEFVREVVRLREEVQGHEAVGSHPQPRPLAAP